MKKIMKTLHAVEQWRKIEGIWQMVGDKEVNENVFTLEGLEYVMDVMFNDSPDGNYLWYTALFKNDIDPQDTDTGAFPGWLECGEYDETVRPYYEKEFSFTGTLSNPSDPAVFTINDTVTIYGSAFVDRPSKTGTANMLIASSKWDTPRDAIAGDIVRVVIEIAGSN